MLKQRTIVLALALLVSAQLSACGRKGPLFIERPKPQAAAAPADARPAAPTTPSIQPESGK